MPDTFNSSDMRIILALLARHDIEPTFATIADGGVAIHFRPKEKCEAQLSSLDELMPGWRYLGSPLAHRLSRIINLCVSAALERQSDDQARRN